MLVEINGIVWDTESETTPCIVLDIPEEKIEVLFFPGKRAESENLQCNYWKSHSLSECDIYAKIREKRTRESEAIRLCLNHLPRELKKYIKIKILRTKKHPKSA